MSYLIDTNVLSELRKGRRCNKQVKRWSHTVNTDELYLSSITIGEIRRGVERIRRRDSQSAQHLDQWLGTIIEQYNEKIIAVDSRIAEQWGYFNVPDPLPAVDSWLAATAVVYRFTLVTRNTKDVQRTGVALLNPFLEINE